MTYGNLLIIRDSSEVEQLTVNQLVVGSIPTRGATLDNTMNIAVAVAKDYKDWETFQSVMDSLVELHPVNYIVAAQPHSLISLYCKIDIVPCYINSFNDRDKYDIGMVFSTAKSNMSDICEIMCYSNRPYYIYHTNKDEFSYVHLTKSLGTT